MAVRINLPDGNNYLAPDNTQEIPPLGSFEVYNNAVNTYNDMIGSFSMNSFEDMQAFLAEIMKVYGQGLVQQEGQIWNDGQRSGVLDELIPFEEDTSGGGTEGEAAEGTDAPSVPGNAVRGYMGYMGFNTALGLVTANKNSIENVAVSVAKGVKGFNAAKAQAELAEAVETMSTTSADDDLAAVVDAYNTARENEHTVPSRTDTAVSTAKNSLMGVNPFGLLGDLLGFRARSEVDKAMEAAHQALATTAEHTMGFNLGVGDTTGLSENAPGFGFGLSDSDTEGGYGGLGDQAPGLGDVDPDDGLTDQAPGETGGIGSGSSDDGENESDFGGAAGAPY